MQALSLQQKIITPEDFAKYQGHGGSQAAAKENKGKQELADQV